MRWPVGTKCQSKKSEELEISFASVSKDQSDANSMNQDKVRALNAVSCSLSTIEQPINRTEEQLQHRSLCLETWEQL